MTESWASRKKKQRRQEQKEEEKEEEKEDVEDEEENGIEVCESLPCMLPVLDWPGEGETR